MNKNYLHLCEYCKKEFAVCDGNPTFVEEVDSKATPPANDAVIYCIGFDKRIGPDGLLVSIKKNEVTHE